MARVAPERHPYAGGAFDLARAGDQTGIGWGLSTQARLPAQKYSPAGCPLPEASSRDVGHTPNAKNRSLICGLYDKHVGFCFRIALRYRVG